MKIKFLPLLVGGLFATSLFFSSCLDNDVEEIVLPAESSIHSFSIGTVSMEKVTKDSLGKDSTYIDTVSCSHYPFTIDQLNRTIENKDSLPVGSDISKILVNIEADTKAILYERKGKNGEIKDTIWTPSDSIDFTRPVAFKVFAQNGMMGKSYMVTVNVHKQIPDTLEWTHFSTTQFASGKLNKQKTVVCNDKLYTFGVKENGLPVAEVLHMNNSKATAWELLTGLPKETNTYSLQTWNNMMFFVADTKLYKLNADGSIESVGNIYNLHTLIGLGNISANKEVLFAYDKNHKVLALNEDGSLANIEMMGFIDNASFNTDRLSEAHYATKHNKALTRTIVMENSTNESDTIANVFGYTTNDNKWGQIALKEPTICPNLENISMIYYDKKLYAFGGGIPSKNIKPFEHFYCSTDNGLTWKKVTRNMVFPQEDSPKHPTVRPFAYYYTPNVEGSYSTTVDQNQFIWIIWENGNVTRGRVNRLGFAQKW